VLVLRTARRTEGGNPWHALAPSIVAVALGGCAVLGTEPMGVRVRDKTRFESEWQRYLALPEAKAIAVAGDLRGTYTSGIAWGEPTAGAAESRALARCQERRADRRIEAPCHMHGVDAQ
jgi:hypothetical protein